MDFRRTTDSNPENNCEYHNKMMMRAQARENKLPAIRFDAIRTGMDHLEAMKLDDS